MLPNFLVIGAPRSGTTSLYEYLRSHPSVYMSPTKEPDFFISPLIGASRLANPGCECSLDEDALLDPALRQEAEAYRALFAGGGGHALRGEASAAYLGDPVGAGNLRRYVPDAKLIAILRDPAERMHSHYVHAERVHSDAGCTAEQSQELLATYHATIDRAVCEGFDGPATNDPEIWLRAGFYHRHITRFRATFPQEQLLVLWFEDLARDPRGLMARVFRFLGVDDTFVLPTTEAFNASVVPKSPGVFRLFTRQNPVMRLGRAIAPTSLRAAAMRTRNRMLAGAKPEICSDTRRKLVSIYRDDILKLQDLMGRDLSSWLDESHGA